MCVCIKLINNNNLFFFLLFPSIHLRQRNDGRSIENDMNRFSFLLYFHYTRNPLKRSKSFIQSKPISFHFSSFYFLKLQFNSFHFQSKHNNKKYFFFFQNGKFNRDPLVPSFKIKRWRDWWPPPK